MPINCYKNIFDQAKERFSEEMKESLAITKKALQTLLVYITTLSSIAGVALSKEQNSHIVIERILLIIASVIGLIGILLLVAPLKGNILYG